MKNHPKSGKWPMTLYTSTQTAQPIIGELSNFHPLQLRPLPILGFPFSPMGWGMSIWSINHRIYIIDLTRYDLLPNHRGMEALLPPYSSPGKIYPQALQPLTRTPISGFTHQQNPKYFWKITKVIIKVIGMTSTPENHIESKEAPTWNHPFHIQEDTKR